MTIVRWEPLREFSTLQNEMNRLFNTVFETPATGGGTLRRWMPAMDLVETDDQFVLRADLPGLSEDDVAIEFDDGTLTVSGERKHEFEGESGKTFRSERYFGKFQRSVTLPAMVDSSKISASYKDGILSVTLPKAEEAKPKQIAVNID